MTTPRFFMRSAGPRVAGLLLVVLLAGVFGWAQPPAAPEIKPAQSETVLKKASVVPLPRQDVRADEPSAAPAFAPGEEPKIVFEKTVADLGSVPEGQKASISFPFKNEGKSDLEILEVRKTCGCTRAEATKSLLKPGESAAVEGEFDTNGRSGKQAKTIHVKSNDPKNPDVTLRFEATVMKEMEVEPSTVYFPSLDVGQEGKQEIKITNMTDKPVRITGIASTNEERIKARVVSPRAEGDGKETESAPAQGEANPIVVEVSVAPSQQLGNFNAMLTVQTDSASKPSFQVSVGGKVAGDLDVNPPNVFFGLLRDTQPTTRTATISSRSGIPFKITKVETAGIPMNVVSVPLDGKEGYRLEVGLSGELKEQRNNGTIHLETTHPKQGVVDIGVTAFIRSAVVKPPAGSSEGSGLPGSSATEESSAVK